MNGKSARNPTDLINAPRGRRLSERVRTILAAKSLSVYTLAALSRLRHPGESPHHLPHNLLFQLESERWSPTIQHLVSLAELSGYRLADWFRIFGLDLDDIAGAQAILTRPRTALLDGRIHTNGKSQLWFNDRAQSDTRAPVTPIGQHVEPAGPFLADRLPFPQKTSRFSYAKIGWQDAFAFPDLTPGSIVRAYSEPTNRNRVSTDIFLLEHCNGVCCSRLHFVSDNRVALAPTQLPFASVELELGLEARILGIVDLELRPLVHLKTQAEHAGSSPEVAPELARLWAPVPIPRHFVSLPPSQLLRKARLKAGLSLRAASAMSRDIAKELCDERYFVSQGSLSDYEASDRAPRHIHKLFSLSVLYALSYEDLFRSYGIDLTVGTDPMPYEWFSDQQELRQARLELPARHGFFADHLAQLGEIPFFACTAFQRLSGSTDLSLHDLFWVDTRLSPPTHPALAGASLIVVNRRKTTPPAYLRKSIWDRRLYLVVRRDGTYLLGACTLEEKTIVAHTHSKDFARAERFRNRIDAEVVGQIIAVFRSVRLLT